MLSLCHAYSFVGLAAFKWREQHLTSYFYLDCALLICLSFPSVSSTYLILNKRLWESLSHF